MRLMHSPYLLLFPALDRREPPRNGPDRSRYVFVPPNWVQDPLQRVTHGVIDYRAQNLGIGYKILSPAALNELRFGIPAS